MSCKRVNFIQYMVSMIWSCQDGSILLILKIPRIHTWNERTYSSNFHICVMAHLNVHIHILTHSHIYTLKHIHIQAHTHTIQTHIYTHTHRHIRVP